MLSVSSVEKKHKHEEKVEEALLTIPICRVVHPSSKVSQPFPRRLLKTSGQTDCTASNHSPSIF